MVYFRFTFWNRKVALKYSLVAYFIGYNKTQSFDLIFSAAIKEINSSHKHGANENNGMKQTVLNRLLFLSEECVLYIIIITTKLNQSNYLIPFSVSI